MTKSLIDYAFDLINSKKEQVSFAEIWAYVKKEAGLSDEEAADKVARFYTNLMLDGRFVTLGENNWDLRVRHTFDKVHIDMKDVYNDVEESEDVDEEEVAEEKEYEDQFENGSSEENSNGESSDEESEEENF